MAIISAGVIMNVIFAFLMAVVAFSLGVEQTPCVIGTVFPGEPAWQADLRVGDDVLKIAGKKMEQFRDLQTAISLGDIDPEEGVPIEVRRAGVKEPLTVIVKPDRSRGAFFIGVGNSYTTRLQENRKTWLVQKRDAVLPGSAADLATPAFRNGDKIVKIDDVPIDNYADINAQLAQKADRKIAVTVLRTEQDGPDKPTAAERRLVIPVAPQPHAMPWTGDEDGADRGGPGGFARRGRGARAWGRDREDRRQRGLRPDDAARPTPPPRGKDGRTDHPAEGREDFGNRSSAAARSRRAFSLPTSFSLTSRWKRRPWELPTAS